MVWKTSCSFELANFKSIEKDLLFCFKKANVLLFNELENKEEDENV